MTTTATNQAAGLIPSALPDFQHRIPSSVSTLGELSDYIAILAEQQRNILGMVSNTLSDSDSSHLEPVVDAAAAIMDDVVSLLCWFERGARS